jgi:DNA-binding transcriptional LysR family regulator
MLDLRQLRILAAVAESGSMTGAAAELAYTPSAISQQMAALERAVGAPLLVRHARGVRLTAAGELLVERLGEIDNRLRGLESDVTDLVQLRSGRLRLGAFASAATRLLPPAIDSFRRRFPGITMTLDLLDPQDAVDALHGGRLDLAVIFDYPDGPRVDTGQLERHALSADRMFIALPADHPQADRTSPIGLEALRHDHWIRDCSPDPTCREVLDMLCRQAGFRPSISFESDNYLAIGRLISTGAGVAMIPGLGAEQMPEGVRLRPIRPAVARRVSVLPAPGAAPSARTMISILREVSRTVAAEVSAQLRVEDAGVSDRRARPAPRR